MKKIEIKRFRFKRFRDLSENEQIKCVTQAQFVLLCLLCLVCVVAMFALGSTLKNPIQTETEESQEVTYTVDEIHLCDVVRNEVDRQLQAINPVKIEFVNVEEPVKPATYIDFIPMDAGYQAILFQAIKEYHIGRGFALALMESESTFDVDAKTTDANGITYYGAWQISEVNAYRIQQEYGLDITNPEENLVAGCALLSELITKYGVEYGSEYVINAYKGGEGAAKEWYEEGYKLPCCDEITGRAMYWDEVLKGEE